MYSSRQENKFKKGLILGGILAVASAVGFSRTKEGQKLTADFQQDIITLVKRLRKNLGELEDVTKEKFDKTVDLVVDEYAEKKQLIGDAKKTILNQLHSKWSEMEKEYFEDTTDEKTKKKTKK
jgi:gas vesicle protein